MAEEHEEASTGESQSFAVIPMKYITPIILILIVIGTVGQMIAKNWIAQIGPVILKPFISIFWAYGIIMIMLVLTGDRKSPSQVFVSIVPMLVLALIIPMTFGFEDMEIWWAIIFMVAAPFIGNAIRGLIRGGAAGIKERSAEAFWSESGEEWDKIWEEEGGEPTRRIREGDIAAIRDAAQALITETT